MKFLFITVFVLTSLSFPALAKKIKAPHGTVDVDEAFLDMSPDKTIKKKDNEQKQKMEQIEQDHDHAGTAKKRTKK